jgi:hypothetical protein
MEWRAASRRLAPEGFYGGDRRVEWSRERIWQTTSPPHGRVVGGEPGSHPEDLDAGDSRLLYKCSVVVAPGTSRPEATV